MSSFITNTRGMHERVQCKFFARGGCLKGARCGFFHDEREPQKNLCTHYQKGSCSFGSQCKFEHVKVSESHSSTPSSSKNPRHSLVSNSVPLAAASTARTSNTSLITSVNPSFSQAPIDNEREEHLRTVEEEQKQIVALKLSADIECSVCLERVLSKTKPSERKFGLLSECDHPFCVSCIRNWRSSSPPPEMDNSALRTCPVCRKHSNFVIPSSTWFSTPAEKQQIVERYKVALSSIDCKHFDSGNGRCPFGPSCFYKHTVKPGSYIWNNKRLPPLPPRHRPRHRSNAATFNIDDMMSELDDMLPLPLMMMMMNDCSESEDMMQYLDAEDLRDDDIWGVDGDETALADIALLLSQMGVEDDEHDAEYYSSSE